MTVDLTKLGFFSGVNYMKQSSLSGTDTLTVPSAGATVTKTINHNLGYIPMFTVHSDIADNGIIWSSIVPDPWTESSLTHAPSWPALKYWATTTDLVIKLTNNTSPASSGSRKIYWVIYKDYGNT